MVNVSEVPSKESESLDIPFHWIRRYPFAYIPVENKHVFISDSAIREKPIGHTHVFVPFL